MIASIFLTTAAVADCNAATASNTNINIDSAICMPRYIFLKDYNGIYFNLGGTRKVSISEYECEKFYLRFHAGTEDFWYHKIFKTRQEALEELKKLVEIRD